MTQKDISYDKKKDEYSYGNRRVITDQYGKIYEIKTKCNMFFGCLNGRMTKTAIANILEAEEMEGYYNGIS